MVSTVMVTPYLRSSLASGRRTASEAAGCTRLDSLLKLGIDRRHDRASRTPRTGGNEQ